MSMVFAGKIMKLPSCIFLPQSMPAASPALGQTEMPALKDEWVPQAQTPHPPHWGSCSMLLPPISMFKTGESAYPCFIQVMTLTAACHPGIQTAVLILNCVHIVHDVRGYVNRLVMLCRCRTEIADLADRKPDVDTWTYSDIVQLTFVTACINETLRLFNAAVGAPRVTTVATELGGYQVRKGTIIISDIYSLHRNEVPHQGSSQRCSSIFQSHCCLRLESPSVLW